MRFQKYVTFHLLCNSMVTYCVLETVNLLTSSYILIKVDSERQSNESPHFVRMWIVIEYSITFILKIQRFH